MFNIPEQRLVKLKGIKVLTTDIDLKEYEREYE
jgi:hypothetical protein